MEVLLWINVPVGEKHACRVGSITIVLLVASGMTYPRSCGSFIAVGVGSSIIAADALCMAIVQYLTVTAFISACG